MHETQGACLYLFATLCKYAECGFHATCCTYRSIQCWLQSLPDIVIVCERQLFRWSSAVKKQQSDSWKHILPHNGPVRGEHLIQLPIGSVRQTSADDWRHSSSSTAAAQTGNIRTSTTGAESSHRLVNNGRPIELSSGRWDAESVSGIRHLLKRSRVVTLLELKPWRRVIRQLVVTTQMCKMFIQLMAEGGNDVLFVPMSFSIRLVTLILYACN